MENIYIIGLLVIVLIVLYFFLRKSNESAFKEGTLEVEEQRLLLARAEEKNTWLEKENEKLHQELKETREKLGISERSLEGMNAYFESQREKLNEQKQEMADMKVQFNKEFELIANRVLEEKSKTFGNTHQKNIHEILQPLKENIKAFEQKIDHTYRSEAAERNALKGVIIQLMEQSKLIRDEANNLAKALKGDSKKQGNWGEIILERVLERSGLTKNREYRIQVSMSNELGNRQQPDVIIDLPDEKHLVIDSKVSLIAYEKWVNCEDEIERPLYIRQHIVSVRNHINELSKKNYSNLYQINSPDFVLLFMPIESAFSMAISENNELFSEAWEKGVVMVSPSTLLATLRTIASMWKQERQTRNVLEIAREAGALYDKFVGFMEDMDKVDKQIGILARIHEDARKKLETGRGSVISKVEKLKQLGAKASKQLDQSLLEIDKDDNNDNE
ncbi:DNA recombination protein RmuC [Olivibacter sitiensis]|uniref:DNA recombination protein RmuC n=1 Tax=Olivibacter sitiensis TaxID=376470 RepID=UPI000412CB48|nr:DNA recombination protein RmuC [Olivibacter sitiensis]